MQANCFRLIWYQIDHATTQKDTHPLLCQVLVTRLGHRCVRTQVRDPHIVLDVVLEATQHHQHHRQAHTAGAVAQKHKGQELDGVEHEVPRRSVCLEQRKVATNGDTQEDAGDELSLSEPPDAEWSARAPV